MKVKNVLVLITAVFMAFALTACGGNDNPIVCDDGYHDENGVCVEDTVDPGETVTCDEGFHVSGGQCVPDTLTCNEGYHAEEGACVLDILTCDEGYHQEGTECVVNPLVCETGYHPEDGTCVVDTITCETGYHQEGTECVLTPIVCDPGYHQEGTSCELTILTCPDGQHQEGTSCVVDLVCPSGSHEVDGACVLDEVLRTFEFQAEYTYLDDQIGFGYSGGTSGTGLIRPAEDYNNDPGASNGFFLSYLYGDGVTITFEFTSDRAVDDAVLYFRLSAELEDMTITDDMVEIRVNGVVVPHDDWVFENVAGINEGVLLPFADFEIGTISLVEGANTVVMEITNEIALEGTMYATAPLLDSIKIKTVAVLNWSPITTNLAAYE